MQTSDLPETKAAIAAATLTGDIRDFMLGQAKRNSKRWEDRSEREQQSFIDACTQAAEDVARKAVQAVSSRGFDAIEFQFGSIMLKDGSITAQAKFEGTIENLTAISGGGRAMIVLARPAAFFGERAQAKAMPDQPDLYAAVAEDASAPINPTETGPLSPEAQSNAERLDGIIPLNVDEATSETAPARRRGRRSAEERTAANAAATTVSAPAHPSAP